ncbi:MAG: DUF1080 domain-containing protein [Roseivirga sp.]|nr:DUF1080 domain-containing protein [Roseivirga sp.]
MKRHIIPSLLILSLLAMAACGGDKSKEKESLAQKAPPARWINLFNGKDFEGWQMFGKREISSQWKVEDGLIKCNSDSSFQSAGQQSLVTIEQYGDFELQLEFRITENGNSGIMYHVSQAPEYKTDYETGPEFQILDDNQDPNRPNNKRLASNYDVYAPIDNKPFKGINEWNLARIIYNKGHVEHWLNGTKVLEFEEGSDDWKQRVANSKWATMPDYAKFKIGHISLQDHGDEVWYRNVKIRRP